jgi:single-stranded DNA-binding protein
MPNEIVGKIFKFSTERTGQGTNGPWINLQVVFETTTERIPRKVAIQFWGDRANEIKGFQVGSELKISFDLESREWQEKWYTDARAWKIERIGATVAPGATYVNAPQAAQSAPTQYAPPQPASNYSPQSEPVSSGGADNFNPPLAAADDDLPF